MKRHIILTQDRSGSNFLANSLNLHPNVVNLGEVLGSWTVPNKLNRVMRVTGRSDRDFLELLYRSQILFYSAQVWSAIAHLRKQKPINFKRLNNVKSIGIKEFCFNFQRLHLEDFLLENPDIAVIHLRRENLLHRCLSLQSMKRNGIILATSKPATVGKMYIDPEELLAQLDRLQEDAEYEHNLIRSLNKNPILQLSYEEAYSDASSLQVMVRQVFEFLGVPPIECTSNHRKILPKSLQKIVENYGELVTALQKTRYAQYLSLD